MNIRLQIILIIVFCIAIFVILDLCRKKKLELKYGLPWLAVLILMLVLSIFPQILAFFSNLLGIAVPVNMLMLFMFFVMTCLILSQTIVVSKLSNNVKRLTQEIALLEGKLKEENKKID